MRAAQSAMERNLAVMTFVTSTTAMPEAATRSRCGFEAARRLPKRDLVARQNKNFTCNQRNKQGATCV